MLKPLLLIAEDNPDVRDNLKMTLEFNDFEVVDHPDGRAALNYLKKSKRIPDMIISDISMPKMNGYDFFKNVSRESKWARIPFVFLSAFSAPEDVRLGKILGVDDYITKPVIESDLLAVIEGKLNRSKAEKEMQENALASMKLDLVPSLSPGDETSVIVFKMDWDPDKGPILHKFYSPKKGVKATIEHIGKQLFLSNVSIYGQSKIDQAQGLLLKMLNIKRSSYVYFDMIRNKQKKTKKRIMIAVIAKKINYLESLAIREHFKELVVKIKMEKRWGLSQSWKKITKILTSPSL